jgi:hypothetical protein
VNDPFEVEQKLVIDRVDQLVRNIPLFTNFSNAAEQWRRIKAMNESLRERPNNSAGDGGCANADPTPAITPSTS